MIWGILIVLLGVAIIVKAVFHVDLPIFRIGLGLVLLYLGVQLILGWPRWHWPSSADGGTAIFAHREIRLDAGQLPQRSYSVVFGRTVLDLTELDLTKVAADKGDVDVEFNVVFGDATVRVKSATPLEVDANVAFGNAELPDRSQVAVGRQVYRSDNAVGAPVRLRIRANVAFGRFNLDRG